MTGRGAGSAAHIQTLKVRMIALLGGALVWLICSTLRYRWEGPENLRTGKNEEPVILAFWHNQIFLATYVWRFRRIAVLTSRHFDGEYIARIIERFGYEPARGSSRRGGVQALLQLKRHLEGGKEVAFPADGPTGPVYKVKPGPLWLSGKTGSPIIPFHVQPRRYWALNSWDGFRIPKPFSPVLVKIGQPLRVPPQGPREIWLQHYQQEMDRIRDYCESYWGASDQLAVPPRPA